MKWAVVLFAVLLFALPVRADTLFPVPSTPDISVSTTATTEVVFTGSRGYVDWIYLKNDCPAGALYFDLRDVRDAAAHSESQNEPGSPPANARPYESSADTITVGHAVAL